MLWSPHVYTNALLYHRNFTFEWKMTTGQFDDHITSVHIKQEAFQDCRPLLRQLTLWVLFNASPEQFSNINYTECERIPCINN